MKSLENQIAVVTGAGRGIGRAIALKFAEAGAEAVGGADPGEPLDAGSLRATGGEFVGGASGIGDAAGTIAVAA